MKYFDGCYCVHRRTNRAVGPLVVDTDKFAYAILLDWSTKEYHYPSVLHKRYFRNMAEACRWDERPLWLRFLGIHERRLGLLVAAAMALILFGCGTASSPTESISTEIVCKEYGFSPTTGKDTTYIVPCVGKRAAQ